MIKYWDILFRRSCLKEKKDNIANVYFVRESVIKNHSFESLKSLIHDWKSISTDESVALESVIETIDGYFTENMNSSRVKTIGGIFNNEVLMSLNNIRENKSLIKNFANKYKLDSILECMNNISIIDRIYNNHQRLNKGTGFDSFIKENCIANDMESIKETVYGLCSKIDSYNMTFDKKFNVALENIMYGLSKGNIRYDKSIVLEYIADYFTIKEEYPIGDLITIQKLLKETKIYEEKDKVGIGYIYGYNENSEVYIEGKKIDFKDIVLMKALKTFQSSPKKTPEALKAIIKHLYSKSSNNIVEDTPSFLVWMRQFLVFSTIAVNPYLGVIITFVDFFIGMNVKRSEAEKMLSHFKAEKEKAQKKMEKSKDPKKKEKDKEYIKTLDESIEKIENYADSLYTDKENDKRKGYDSYDEAFVKPLHTTLSPDEYFNEFHSQVCGALYQIYDQLKKKDSIYFKLDDIECIRRFEYINTDSIYRYTDSDGRLFIKIGDWLGLYQKQLLSNTMTNDNDISRMVQSIVLGFCENLSTELPDDFNVSFDGDDELYHIYISIDAYISVNDSNDSIDETTIYDYARLLALEESMAKAFNNSISIKNIASMDVESISNLNSCLEASNIIDYTSLIEGYSKIKKDIIHSDDSDKYRKTSVLESGIFAMKNSKNNRYVDYLEEFAFYNNIVDMVTEMKVGSNVKLAAINTKKKVQALSDKEKDTSRELDSMVERMSDKIQRHLTNKNREAVIKGSLIPSFSAIIKIAIAAGTVAAISPAISAIGLLAGIALSKRATDKERQYILDEIEVQLKIVEKKIQLAENNNDMKAMEELLKIQKKLRREKQRITYKGKARSFDREMD